MKVWTAIVCVGLVALSAVEAADDKCKAGCAEIYKPVCGSDGKTYENQCAFDYKKCSTKDDKLTVVAQGECGSSASGSGAVENSVCFKGCPKIMMPVCGSDGKSYSNECELNNAKCKNATLTQVSKGYCGSAGSAGSAAGSTNGGCTTTMCLADYSPVCGSDGKTYSNECQLNNAKCKDPSVTMASTGECSAVSRIGDGKADGSTSPAPTTKIPTPAPTSSTRGVVIPLASVVVAAVASTLL